MNESKSSATLIRVVSLLLLLGALGNNSLAAPGDLDLSFDTGSGINGQVRTMVIQPDGKVLIGGEFTTVKGVARTALARLNADGSGDSNFLAGIPLPGGEPIRKVHLLALQPDGKVVAAHEPYGLSRFSTNGTPDTAFNTNALAVLFSLGPDIDIGITSVIAQPDGKVLVGGYQYLVRLNSDGTRDPSFNADVAHDPFYPNSLAFALQSDGKVLVAVSSDSNTLVATGLIRLNANGSVDGTFDSFTNVSGTSHSRGITGVAAQPDGRIVIGGVFTAVNGVSRLGLARLNSNGSVDMSFNPAQSSEGFVLQPDGKVHLGKTRLNSDGSLDSTFNFPGESEFQSFAVTAPTPALQPDGKVILAGVINTIARHALVRFNTDGSHDTTLDTGTRTLIKVPFEAFSSIRVQPGGKVLIGGFSTLGPGAAPAFVHGTNIYGTRGLNPDGSPDQTFIPANFYAYFTNIGPTIDLQVYSNPWDSALKVGAQSDGKVIIAGLTYATYCDESGCFTETFPFLDRAHADGSRDTNFHPGVNVDMGVTDLAVLSNDKILVATFGSFSAASNRYPVARLNADGSLDNTFAPPNVLSNAAGPAYVSSLAVQGDGRVLIGGAFSSVNGTSRNGIARLNGNGTLDTTFDPGTGPDGEVGPIALQANGKVLVTGVFTNVNGITRNRIARLNANGSHDTSFNPGSGPDGFISAIAVQPDGNILIAGDFTTVNGTLRPYVARLLGDSGQPPNLAPTVSISSPAEGSTFTAPATIAINVDAADSDGTVTRVDVYAGDTLIGSDNSPPFDITWNNVAPGNYALTADATDNLGAVATSTPVNISVTNSAPVVTISQPADGATFAAPATITISVDASDRDGTIAQVDVYAGDTFIGSDNAAPFEVVWNNAAAGNYSLTADATDNLGATTTSAAINIQVTPPGPPAVPSGLSATAVSRKQINLSWTDNATNELGFKIERSTNGKPFKQIAKVGANVTTFSNTGLAAGNKYSYRVRAYNALGKSPYSNTATARTSRRFLDWLPF